MWAVDTFTLAKDIRERLGSAFRAVRPNSISDPMVELIRRHFQQRHMGSRHWAVDKVQPLSSGSTNVDGSIEGSVAVDVAGANRAYQDITIRPKFGRWLTIPINPMAWGKNAGDFKGLFKPKGKNILAISNGNGGIVALFALARSAFQRRDPSLMPSDGDLAESVGTSWVRAAFSNMVGDNNRRG